MHAVMGAAQAVLSRVDGVNYAVTGDGPHALVLLHGFADNVSTWNRVVPRLAVDHKVIAIDLPGFGSTTRAWTRPLLPGYVNVVRDVLDAEGITGPVSLMGNSMGAAVSLLFAARFPQRADRIVLIDMPALRTVPRLWRMAMSRPTELALRTGIRGLPNGVAQYGLGFVYTRIAAARPGRLDPLVREGFLNPYALRDRLPALFPLARVLLDELRTAKFAPGNASATVPVLIVFGSRDMLTPARVVRRLDKPGGAVVLPVCGHCPQIDRPGELLSAVLPFLSGQ